VNERSSGQQVARPRRKCECRIQGPSLRSAAIYSDEYRVLTPQAGLESGLESELAEAVLQILARQTLAVLERPSKQEETFVCKP
jgi:hypothetical protein